MSLNRSADRAAKKEAEALAQAEEARTNTIAALAAFNEEDDALFDLSLAEKQPSAEQQARQLAKEQERKSKMPWVEKYRPETLSQVISHGPILSTIDKMISSGGVPHLLLYGPPGTGKTTTAFAIARQLNGSNYRRMLLELNASDERGIDTIRDKVKTFASSRQISATGIKLVILDEADSMTRVAQYALRRIMELYAHNTRFIIIANYVNKLIPAVQSRCTRFRFGPLDSVSVYKHLRQVATQEQVEFTTEGLQHVIQLSHGDMRMCLNIMQACKAAYNLIDEEHVYLCTGAPRESELQIIVKTLLNESFAAGVACLQTSQRNGLSMGDILTGVHEVILRLNIPDAILAFMLPRLATIEASLAQASSESTQLYAIVGVFQLTKEMLLQHGNNPEQLVLQEKRSKDTFTAPGNSTTAMDV